MSTPYLKRTYNTATGQPVIKVYRDIVSGWRGVIPKQLGQYPIEDGDVEAAKQAALVDYPDATDYER